MQREVLSKFTLHSLHHPRAEPDLTWCYARADTQLLPAPQGMALCTPQHQPAFCRVTSPLWACCPVLLLSPPLASHKVTSFPICPQSSSAPGPHLTNSLPQDFTSGPSPSTPNTLAHCIDHWRSILAWSKLEKHTLQPSPSFLTLSDQRYRVTMIPFSSVLTYLDDPKSAGQRRGYLTHHRIMKSHVRQ